MRLLVELLLGLALLSSIADAQLFYRATGEFECNGEPAQNILLRTVEHDPKYDDVTNIRVDDWFDHVAVDEDGFVNRRDPLELTIHAFFTCGDCKAELYQYIEYDDGQFYVQESALHNPASFGTVELSDACRYGEVKSRYSDWVELKHRKQWIVRHTHPDIRGHFKYID